MLRVPESTGMDLAPAEVVEEVATERWIARLYRPKDRDGVLRLAREHMPNPELSDLGFLDWLNSSPAGSSIAVVAEERATGRIIGFLWNVPVRVSRNGASAIAYMSCYGLVDPEYRRDNAYDALLRLSKDLCADGLYVYGFAKPIAVLRVLTVGFRHVGQIPLMVRPMNTARLTRDRIERAWMRLGLRIGWAVAGRTVFRQKRPWRNRWNLRVRQESGFDSTFDGLWQRVAPEFGVAIARDRAFLDWRFPRRSFRDYVVFTARAGDELVGYIVARCAELEGIPTGLISDFLVEPGARGRDAGLRLLAAATRYFGEQRVALGGGLMPAHTREYQLLKEAGYLQCPERFAPQPFRLVALPFADSPSNRRPPSVDQWFVTMADHDAV